MYLVSKTGTFAKLFFLLCVFGLLMYTMLGFYSFHTAMNTMSKVEKVNKAMKIKPDQREIIDKDLKYILLWTIPESEYNFTSDGQQLFINNNCAHLNCYLTTKKDFFDNDIKNFDAIVFNISTLKKWKYMPTRSPKQIYVFYSMTSAEKYPVCNIRADSFFNWTWSYKLNSDIVTPFIEVRDMANNVVAPKFRLDWAAKKEMEYTSLANYKYYSNNIAQLVNKTKAVMWCTDSCDKKSSDNTALIFALQLKRALNENGLTLDIYGCDFNKCPKDGCSKALERDYYFYLAYEDSVSEDYVTTEVLKAYHHNAVPIVVGGADYINFLPFDSYIDAAHESKDLLASLINYTIKTPNAYKRLFAWKKYFTINKTELQKGYCDLCAMLNDKKQVEKSKTYEHFRRWWFYGSLKERCNPKGAESDDVLSSV